MRSAGNRSGRVALALYGGAFGLLDVAMNVQAVAVVRRLGRPIMPWFHAAFSLGGLAGATTGALAAELGLSPPTHFLLAPPTHFLLVGSASAAVVLSTRRHLLPDSGARPDDTGRRPGRRSRGTPSRRNRRFLVGLGAVAACAAMGEGAMADWTALFLREATGARAGVAAALGFAAFSITMTAGRLGGEAAIRRLGAVRVLRLGVAHSAASPRAACVGSGSESLRHTRPPIPLNQLVPHRVPPGERR